jgi:molybdenum cofactor sulfurtransferase
LATTAPLDLSDPAAAPDFTAISFYKIFGFPNIGALIVRKASAHVLQDRRYFGGGTVDMIISINDTWHAKKDATVHDRLEDGTLPFHSIFALDHGISVHERLYGLNPMRYISMHTAQLGLKLYEGLSKMMHSNGTPVVRIYKDAKAIYGDPSVQGATIAFNVQRPDGSLIGFEEVEKAADERQIYVRSGSLCNPGGVATYLEWSPAEMRAAYASGHRCANPRQIVLGKATGVVRVSLGAMSIVADVTTFLDFLEDVYVDRYRVEPKVDAKASLISLEKIHDCEPFLMSLEKAQDCVPSLPHSLSARSESRASAGQASQVSIKHSSPHAMSIPPSGYDPSASPRPSLEPVTGIKGAKRWADSTTAIPSSVSAHEIQDEPSRSNLSNLPFMPSDCTSDHRLCENEMRKHTTIAEAEAKLREMEKAIAAANRNGETPSNSVKAQRFGRSVVNLLRQKFNHALAGNAYGYGSPDK